MTTDNAINTGRKMQTEGNRRRIEPIIDTVIKVDGMDLHYMIIIEIIEFDWETLPKKTKVIFERYWEHAILKEHFQSYGKNSRVKL